MLKKIYTSTKGFLSTVNGLAYLKSWDAFLILGTQTNARFAKGFMDGSEVKLGSPPSNIVLMRRVNGGACVGSAWSSGDIWAVDEITGIYDLNHRLSSGVLSYPGTLNGGCLVDDEAGINLVGSSHDLKAYSLNTGALEWTLAGVLPAPAGFGAIHWVAPGRVMCVSGYNTGTLALVDYHKRETLWRSSVGAVPTASAFNSTHNLLLTLDSSRRVSLWALEFVPATLSTPAFVPAPAQVHRLMGYEVRVRLTGDAGEPCEDYWVEWSLLGEPPKGQLEKTYAKTDKDGYAWNFWFGPAGAGETGSETIATEVVV